MIAVEDASVVFETRAGIFKSGQVHALDGVSIEIGVGETLALVGESGSGKTTLGRLTLRLVEPASGTVSFLGRDITHDREQSLGWFRQRAQIVFQDPFSSLNPYMRVWDLIEEPLQIDGVKRAGERRERANAALAAVDLIPTARFGSKYPSQMSGGQRQRVGIARALVRNPDYIVADEPVSMIDASSRIAILSLLAKLQQERGVSFAYITHDIASARYFSDRIAVLYQGTIVETGPVGTVIDHPLHPYTAALIAAIPEPDPANRHRRREVVPGEPSPSSTAPTHCPFYSRCPRRIPGTCDAARPALVEIEPKHEVACFLYSSASHTPAGTP
ncbi:MAG: ABC transporter ATP-binding protein [Thermomicrobiales bacterium]|nr:ABC transporter ATP-binding protein [Thermomicrobiales bacterium]MCO5220219.1 ABC transporter ATP-binding protein [Thermomicrobiales bacterium]